MLEDIYVVAPQQRHRGDHRDRGLDSPSLAMLGKETPIEDRCLRRLEDNGSPDAG